MSLIRRNLQLVAVVAGVLLAAAAVAEGASNPQSAAYTTKGAWSFVSAPSLHPPKVRADVPTVTKKLAGGVFMLANNKNLAIAKPMVGEGGPLILDNHLQPVWFNPVCVSKCGSQNLFAFNLNEQSYLGKPVLGWWQGALNPLGDPITGQDVFVDQHYRTVAKLSATGGWVLSEHDFLISGPNVWVTAYRPLTMDLRPYGGAQNGQFLDSGIQEYNLKTGQLLYTWDALAHISLSDSYSKPPSTGTPAWDAYHVNSIELTGKSTFLVSMRNTWAAYQVNTATGTPEWNLGGKHSTFTFGPKAAFQWQHDVQLHKNGQVSMFDDHCCQFNGSKAVLPPNPPPSRGLVLKLDMTKHRATVARQLIRLKKNFNAAFLGGTQLEPNGNAVVGWGSKPYFSEFGKSGKLLLDAAFPTPDQTGWAWLQHWVATPYYPPSGAVRSPHGKTTVYASWDGATEVKGWRVLGGSNANHLHAVVKRTSKTGFETGISISRSYKVFEVQALNAKGKVIGTSTPFSPAKKQSTTGFY